MARKAQRAVALIGLDGVGPDALRLFLPWMPRLAELLKTYGYLRLETLPPYTPPVWTSVTTGVNPGRHGIAGFLKVERRGREIVERKLTTAEDVRYPRIWEYLAMMRKRCVVVGFPLTYPPGAMYLRNTILITGWDSPRVVGHPPGIEAEFPEILLQHQHIRAPCPSAERAHVRRFLKLVVRIVKKRLGALRRLVIRVSPEFLGVLIPETDWIQHLFVRGPDDFEECPELGELLEEIDSFVGAVAGRFDLVLIVSDHDLKTYDRAYNVIYPLIDANLVHCALEEQAEPGRGRPPRFVKTSLLRALNLVISSETLGRVLMRHARLRRLLVSGPARVLGAKIVLKRVHLIGGGLGIYLSERDPPVLDFLVREYRRIGLCVLKAAGYFWGPHLDELPDLIPDASRSQPELGISWALDDEPTLRFSSPKRLHAPHGILAIAGDAEVSAAGPAMPWDVGATVLAALSDVIPDDLDGRCLLADREGVRRAPLRGRLLTLRRVACRLSRARRGRNA